MTNSPLARPTKTTATNMGSRQDVKVKVFYTFQGTETTCLCSLMLPVDVDNDPFVQIPLKECLMSVCSSCPDMLLYPDADCAVYSANFQETGSAASSDRVVWEGHGLLSWVMDGNHDDNLYVCGQVVRDQEIIFIKVVLQLHPTHRISRGDYYHTFIHRRGLQPAHPSSPPSPSAESVTPPRDAGTRRVSNSLPSLMQLANLDPSPRHPAGTESGLPTPVSASVGGHPHPLHPPPAPASAPARSPSPFAHVLSPINQLPHPSDTHAVSGALVRKPFYSPLADQDANLKRRRLSPTTSVSLPPPSALFGLHRNSPSDAFFPSPQPASVPQQHSAVTTTTTTALTHVVPAPIPMAPASTSLVSQPTTHMTAGRRKKRDTKPPNANDIRTFVEVEKDDNGNYRLPVEIDSWTVLSLGSVVYDRPAFHNQRYIYPVGYKVKKSMINPRSDTQYTCEILDGGQEPVFRLAADDNPGDVYMGPTPTTVWTIAVKRAFAIRKMDYGHNPVGPDFFGLRKNTIAKMIQDLPNADKCHNYIWQTFQIGTTSKTMRGKHRQGSPSTETDAEQQS